MPNTQADLNRAVIAARTASQQSGSYAQQAQQSLAATQSLYNVFIRYITTWKGAWNSGTFYRAYDSVSFSGSSYIAIQNGANFEPDTNPTYWNVIAAGGSGGGGSVHTGGGLQGDGSSGTPVIVSDAGITNAKLATMVSHTFKGNATGGTASPTDLTAVQVANLLPLATGSQQGVVSGANSDKIATLVPPFQGYSVQYVSPTGNNSNDGTFNSPKKTISAAYIALASGGTIYLASGCVWSDGTETYFDHNGGPYTLTAGQGARITGWPYGPTRVGFVPYRICTFQGWGPDSIVNFGSQGVSWTHSSNDRTDPLFWIAPQTLAPTTFKDISFTGNLIHRQGWDYRRNNDASIAWANITGAVRTAGSDTQHTNSVFTVGFPTAWNILWFSRTNNVVTCIFDMSLQPPWTPIPPSCWIRVTSSTSGFGSVDVQNIQADIINYTGPGPTGRLAQVTYTQAGTPTVGFVSGTGTVQSHCCYNWDIIEVESTNPQWPTTIYEVVSTTVDTITVRDPYGYDASGWGGVARTASASGSSIGQYVLQDRQLTNAVDLTIFDNCSGTFAAGATIECFNIGPLMDLGSAYLTPQFKGGGFSALGFDPNGGTPASADYFRSAAIFCYGGSVGASSVKTIDTQFVNGNILFQPSGINVWTIQCANHLQDRGPSNLGTNYLRPLVEVIDNGVRGGGVGAMIRNCLNADSAIDDTHLDVYLGQCGGCFTVEGCYYVGVNPYSAYTFSDGAARATVFTDQKYWPAETSSYESDGKVGWYGADQRLAGKRMDVQSLFGTVQGQGLVNCLDPVLTNWIAGSGNIAVAAGYSTMAIDGGTNAYRVSGAGDLQPVSFISPVAPTGAGDHFVFGAWVRGVNGGPLPNGPIFSYYVSNMEGAVQAVGYISGLAGDGDWQWVSAVGYVDQVSTFDSLRLLSDGNTYDIANLTMLRLPASQYSKNDVFRIHNAFRPFPVYLPAGMTGTVEGQKLIGHGGLGSAKKYVSGTAPGQATLGSTNGNLFELFDELGNSLGVVPLYSYTFHPPLSISPAAAVVAESGNQTFVGAGGGGGYVYSISINHSGGSINSSTGIYTAGTTPGTDTVLVTDSLSATATATARVFAPIGITPSSPTVAAGGKQTFAGTGGSGAYTFSISTNNSGGTINSTTGAYQAGMINSGVTDTVTVTDALLDTANATVTVTGFPMALWLKSNAGVTQSGGLVSAWADQSGNGNNATQATGGLQPAFNSNSVNAVPGITFNGTSTYMAGSNNIVASGTDRSVIVVTKYTSSVNNANTVFTFRQTAPKLALLEGYISSPYIAGDATITNVLMTGGSSPDANPGVYEYYLASEVLTLWMDGVIQPTSGGTLTSDTGATGFLVGAQGPATSIFVGDILEIIVVGHVLNSTEQTNLRQYLQLKYGIGLGV